MIKDLSVKIENIRILQENIGKYYNSVCFVPYVRIGLILLTDLCPLLF
jgi:hypothetical protein